jgi:hypothetical protein
VRKRSEEARRERASRRYEGRCGYCGVAEEDVGATLTVDHHRPRTRGGTHRDENLVYCCHKCNEYKGDYWHETDPPHVALLHPRLDDLRIHVVEREDGRLDGLTPQGEFFIERLRLNRPQLVAHRLRQRAEMALRVEADALRREVSELRQRIGELDAALEQVGTAIDHESTQEA